MENVNLNKALNEAGKFINDKFKVAARGKDHKATGKLDDSFRYTVVANELKFFSEEYAKAVSGGIEDKNKDYNKSSEEFRKDIIKWAKAKGITPRRSKKGRFTSYMAMASAMAISIRRNGISKRFGYKGSGFIQTVKDQTEKKLMEMIDEGYRKDLEANLDKIKTNR